MNANEKTLLTIGPIINELKEQGGWVLGIQEGQWTTSLNLAILHDSVI